MEDIVLGEIILGDISRYKLFTHDNKPISMVCTLNHHFNKGQITDKYYDLSLLREKLLTNNNVISISEITPLPHYTITDYSEANYLAIKVYVTEPSILEASNSEIYEEIKEWLLK